VNTSWNAGSGNVTDSYNSTNGTVWINSSLKYRNTTLAPHAWQNLTIYAYNTSGTGSLSVSALTNNTQIPNNAITISNVSASYSINEGETLYIDADYADADGDTGTFSDNASQWDVNGASGVVSWVTGFTDSGVYSWQVQVSDGYGSTSTAVFTVTVTDVPQQFIPPVPVISTVTTGNFWVNTTWNAGGGNVTDSYNSTNGTAWINSSLKYRNTTLAPHAWQNLTIYAYNTSGTGSLSVSALTNNTQIPNNAITISNVSPSYSINEGETLYIDADYADADGDTGTFSDNASQWDVDAVTGVVSWVTGFTDSGVYSWQVQVSDGYGSTSAAVFTVTVTDVPQQFIPPVPVISTVTTGNFWVNTSWNAGSGNVTDSYNSTNGTVWINSSLKYRNTTLAPHAWQNLTIYAYNTSGTGSLSVSALTNNTQIPNNAITISNVSASYSINEGETLYIDADYADADGDTGTFSDNASQWDVNGASGVVSWVTGFTDSGVYSWQVQVTDGYGSTSTAVFTVTVTDVPQQFIPPVPVISTVTTGNFWVNTTWNAGGGNVTDSYNSTNGTAWINSSLKYRNTTLAPHAWQNLTIYAYNTSGTGSLSVSALTNNTQIPNNVPVLSPIGSRSVNENQTLSLTITATDADGDALTNGTNATKGSFIPATGSFTWTPTFGDSGTYIWYFNSSDGYGGVASEIITVTVNNIPLTITARSPASDVTTILGTARTFNVDLNRTATVTWYINGTPVQTNSSITSASYTNSTAGVGVYNITASVSDAYDTISTMWNWTVNPAPAVAPNITSFAPPSPVNDATGAARTFNITVNQTVNVAWHINGTTVFSQTNVTDSSYTNTSAGLGIWNVTAIANNANGTVSQQWIWNVTPAPSGAPNITDFAPPSPVNDTAGAARTFNITVNQTMNVTWYINGTTIFNQTNVTESSYTNSTASIGIWNVTAIANNTNGLVSKQWVWNVSAATTIIINITSPANNSINDTGYVNVTVTLDVPGTAFLNWGGVNESMNGTGTNVYKNKTGLLSGNYTFRVYANDSGGISNVSEPRTITVNRTNVYSAIANWINTSTFIVNKSMEIKAPSGNVTVTIPNGTNASVGGAAVSSISVDSLAKLDLTCVANLPVNDKLIGENLSLGPDGATFSPDIQVRFNYTGSQIASMGIADSDLTVKFCNPVTNKWEVLAIFERNTINKNLIVNISHFSTFALIGTTAAPPSPAFPPQPVSPGGGGGGGGAGVISPEPFSNIEFFEIREEYLGANVPISYIFTAQDLDISEVLITPIKNFGLTSVRLEKLKDLSNIAGVTKPLGIVYRYYNIWSVKELESGKGFKDAFIGFKVDRSWLAENNLDEGSVSLIIWDGSAWFTLKTAPTNLDEQFVYYVAKTNALSIFAIVAGSTYPYVVIEEGEFPEFVGTFIPKIISSENIWWLYVLIILLLIGIVIYVLRKYKKPLLVPEKAVGKIKEFLDALSDRGFALYKKGKYGEAIGAYDKSIDIIHKSEIEKAETELRVAEHIMGKPVEMPVQKPLQKEETRAMIIDGIKPLFTKVIMYIKSKYNWFKTVISLNLNRITNMLKRKTSVGKVPGIPGIAVDDKLLSKSKKELEDKEKVILDLQKLVEHQHEIIKELREHYKAYVETKPLEETIERLNSDIKRYRVLVKEYDESINKLNAELDEMRLLFQKGRIKYQQVADQLEKERDLERGKEKEKKPGQDIY
jgi:PGF-pre-PGF domain-containing protein